MFPFDIWPNELPSPGTTWKLAARREPARWWIAQAATATPVSAGNEAAGTLHFQNVPSFSFEPSEHAKHIKYSMNQASWQQTHADSRLSFRPSILLLIFPALSQMLTMTFPHPLSVESKLLQLLLRWEGEDRTAWVSEDWITTRRENAQPLSCLSKVVSVHIAIATSSSRATGCHWWNL